MKIYSSLKNKQIDSYAINQMGIPGVVLMQNAAMKIAQTVRENVAPLLNVCVVCGNGNNGGDGYAVAPILKEYGYNVTVVCCNQKQLTADAEFYFEQLDGIAVFNYVEEKYEALEKISRADCVVDAIYGNGFRGSLDEDCANIAFAINSSDAFVIAVDIPSGCICNTGRIEGDAVKANVTVALSTLKPCYFIYPACEYCGKVELKDIGIPQEAYESVFNDALLVTKELCSSYLKKRPKNSHKGTFGKLLMVCGSENMPGAARLAVGGALRSGVGIVNLASVDSVCNKVSFKFEEPIYSPFETQKQLFENLQTLENGCNGAVVGCGLGKSAYARNIVDYMVHNSKLSLVLDADGINVFKPNINILSGREGGFVITPHPKELALLLGDTVENIQADRIGNAKHTAKLLNCVVVLKGANTVIATPEGEVFINTTGNSGLAKGGSGDVLAGIIGSLLAQGYKAQEAAVLGVYIHGLAADFCIKDFGEESMLPSDLPLYFSKVFKVLKGAE